MKFSFRYILLITIGFLQNIEVKAQCTVSASANLIQVECGANVDLSAIAGNPVLSTSFNNFQNGLGWSSNTTKERLNGLTGVNIWQKDFVWYLNGEEWNGEWIRIGD